MSPNARQGLRPQGVGNLACTDLEPQWLLAQSVPSASLVPCLRSLPVGWSVGPVTVNYGRSVIPLDHDLAGTSVLNAILGYTTRQTLQQALHRRSEGRLRLDPTACSISSTTRVAPSGS